MRFLLVRVRLSLAARRHAARPDTEAKGDAHATESYEGKALASLTMKLRLTNQSRYTPAGAAAAAGKGTPSRKTVGVVRRSAACQCGSARAVCASAQRTKGQESIATEHSGGINDP